MKLRTRTALAALALTLGLGTASQATGARATSKDDCKKGGWQTLVRSDLSPFKNQGDCVSYVATGGVFGIADPGIDAARTLCGQFGGQFLLGGGADTQPNAVGLWRCLGFPYALFTASADSCLSSNIANQWLALGFEYGSDPFVPESVDVLCQRSIGS